LNDDGRVVSGKEEVAAWWKQRGKEEVEFETSK
jgi:hypothetical protein